MPITPLHLGPSSWLGLLLSRFLDIPTLLVASVVVDIEPFCVLFLGAPGPLHGFWHSFLGGSIAALATALLMYRLKGPVQSVSARIGLGQESSAKKVLLTSFIGVYSHVLLDSFLYRDIKPFYPSAANPLLGLVSARQVYLFCLMSFAVGLFVYLIRRHPSIGSRSP